MSIEFSTIGLLLSEYNRELFGQSNYFLHYEEYVSVTLTDSLLLLHVAFIKGWSCTEVVFVTTGFINEVIE